MLKLRPNKHPMTFTAGFVVLPKVPLFEAWAITLTEVIMFYLVCLQIRYANMHVALLLHLLIFATRTFLGCRGIVAGYVLHQQ